MDNRAVQWRVRLRIYAAERLDDPAADSDPELPPEHPGSAVLRGLPEVASYMAELCQGYHRRPCVGLDSDTLRHKLKALRPTLSRRGGNGVWRVQYQTMDDSGKREWIARADIERAEG